MIKSAKLALKGNKLWLKNVEVVLVCVLIIGVWGLLSLPVIFYHLPLSEISSNNSESKNRTAISTDSVCSAPLRYVTTSGICITELANILTSSNCSTDPEGNVLVVRNEEARATQIIKGLASIGASAECKRKAVPFLCLHLFGLCGGSEVSIQPTISQCEEIRNILCQQHWMFVEEHGIDLADCAMLPAEASSCPAQNDSLSTNGTYTRNISEKYPTETKVEVLECTKEYSEGLSIFTDVVVFISAFMGFVAAIAVIIISCLRYERMLVFPSIFSVYMTIDGLVLALFVMVNYMDRNKLFCSSRSLIESLRVVTPFCVISGILLTYVFFQWALWWLFHTTVLFWMVIFPFHARTLLASGRNKYIHLTYVTVGVLLPLLPIIASMANNALDVQKQNENSTSQHKVSLFLSGGLGFSSSRFPPILCTGTYPDTIFYSLVLVIDIILEFGCTLLIIMIWSLHRQSLTISQSRNRSKFGRPEKKLLIVFCYYVILAVVAITAFTLASKNASFVVDRYQKYFFCEQGGHDPSNPCSLSDIEKYRYPVLSLLSYFFVAMFPFVNLLYAVNIKELMELWTKCVAKK